MRDALWAELVKARRSRLPWVTVLAFTVAALSSTLLCALIAIAVRGDVPFGERAYWLAAQSWWIGDFLGALIVTPLLLTVGFHGFAHSANSRGGLTATLLDSCMGLAVQSTLERGIGQTTLEFKISLLRPITPGTGAVKAEGLALSRGRRVGTAEGRITDGKGSLLAHGTTTCMIFPL